MKVNRLALVIVAVTGIAVTASAQVTYSHPNRTARTGAANMQGIAQVQQDLMAAISAMKSALPIYDGMRVKSIELSHKGLMVVDHAMLGSQAPKRMKPMVFDNISSKTAHVHYSATQVAASQVQMQSGLQALNQATVDLQRATNGILNAQGKKVATDLQEAIAQATGAIALHNH